MIHEEQFEEIFDFYEIPLWQTGWFQIVMVVLALCLVILIAYLVINRKKRTLHTWEVAIQQLNKINLDPCVTKRDFKKVYFEISTILKNYMQQRYGWKIVDKTDNEFVAYLQKNHFDTELIEDLQKLLLGTSLIKYADEVALKTQVEKDLKVAYSFIQKTIPIE